MSNFQDYIKQLEGKIQASYEESITVQEAEKLAAEFLHAQMQVSSELRTADLDARMRKQGVKAIRGAIYLSEATKSEKKPTEAMLAALVDTNDLVAGETKAWDEAEAKSAELHRLFDIFNNAHVYFRGIAKGSIG